MFFRLCCLPVVLGVVLSCGIAGAVEEKPNPATVFVNKIKKAELFDLLSYPARITPTVNTNLLAETDGIVSRIVAPLGQRVSRGQVLMVVTHTDPVYQYAPANIKAPVLGVVSALEVTEGTQVVKGQKLGTVTDPSQIRITIEVPAQDLRMIKRGMQGEFRISGVEKATSVRVRGISPFVDPATGTASCEIDLERRTSGAPVLMPGIVGQVSFKANVRQGISVPDSSITYKGDAPFVRLVEQNKARRVAVKLGNRQRGLVEIVDGLNVNSVLIERASRFVADGETVIVQSPEQK